MKRNDATKWMDGATQVLIGATAAVAACIALSGAGLGARAQAAGGQPGLYQTAMASYQARQWPLAYEQFAAAADAGDRSAARVATMMVRHGPPLFGRRFEAGPDRLARWERAADEAAPAATSRETDARTAGSPPGVQVARAR